MVADITLANKEGHFLSLIIVSCESLLRRYERKKICSFLVQEREKQRISAVISFKNWLYSYAKWSATDIYRKNAP